MATPVSPPVGMGQFGSGSSIGKGSSKLFRLIMLIPLVLPAALHLSAVFKIFAAAPIVFAFLRFGRKAGAISIAVNFGIVFAIGGMMDAVWFLVLGGVLGSTLSESIQRKLRVEYVVLISVGAMILASSLVLGVWSYRSNTGPLTAIKTYVGQEVDIFVKNAEQYKATTNSSSRDLDKLLVDPEMTKRNLLVATPSILIISLLLIVVANLLLILRLNLAGTRRKLGLKTENLRNWKTPDHLVWPTLATGFCLVVEIPGVSDFALNVFRVLMAVYALQGFAILSFLFDVWKVKGFLRPLGFILAVSFLLPLVISLGFFDLWFNFREKFSNTAPAKSKKK